MSAGAIVPILMMSGAFNSSETEKKLGIETNRFPILEFRNIEEWFKVREKFKVKTGIWLDIENSCEVGGKYYIRFRIKNEYGKPLFPDYIAFVKFMKFLEQKKKAIKKLREGMK